LSKFVKTYNTSTNYDDTANKYLFLSTADTCKKRWKGLRDSYFREIKKGKMPSGSAAIDSGSKWKYFENMDFLRTVPRERK